jgi:4-amino-4-deoxy-L-arabinose transferase-like glycosyltransferase
MPTSRRSLNEAQRVRLTLILILICGAFLYFWQFQTATNNPFYTVAARSMSGSWKAFFFGSFNPGNSITIDKIPGYLWPQALSARVFGFHPWSLTLPEVIEALVTVFVTYRLVSRWAGQVAGLCAAAVLVLTPALIGAARLNNEESAFVMCLVLAASATERAVASGRLRPLIIAGAWVGLAFQCKMVEAWAVLPALAAAYLLAAPPRFVRRLIDVAIAGAVTLAVSIFWIVIVALVPAADRPYIDGTTNNNPFSMVFGYNALTRFGFLGVSPSSVGSVTSVFAATSGRSTVSATATHASGSISSTAVDSAAAYRSGAGGGDSQGGLLAMFERAAASQIGWFFALALVSIVAVCWLRRRQPRTDVIRAGVVMWAIWLVIYGAAYSEGQIHTYYVVALAPAVAALCGLGVVELWRAFNAGGRREWLLPPTVALSVVWAIYIVAGYPTYRGWLIPVLVVLGVVAVAALVITLLQPDAGRDVLILGVVASVLAVLVAPGAWASTVIGSSAGTVLGNVGPSSSAHGGSGSGDGGTSGTLTTNQAELLAYAEAHDGGAEFVLTVVSWDEASPYIVAAGANILPMSGFTGQAPFPTLAQFQQYVRLGEVRFVVLPLAGTDGIKTNMALVSIENWVFTTCSKVSALAYGGAIKTTTGNAAVVYECTTA